MAINVHSSLHVHSGPWLRKEFIEPYGLSAETLMRMQIAYALAQARRNADRLEIERIPAPV